MYSIFSLERNPWDYSLVELLCCIASFVNQVFKYNNKKQKNFGAYKKDCFVKTRVYIKSILHCAFVEI